MVQTATRSLASLTESVPDWVRLALRLSVAALVAKPALSKFVTHEGSVAFFSRIGIPFPTVMVLAAGAVEIAAVALLFLGVRERLAALSLLPVMVVAIVYVGPAWNNLAVLGGSLAIVVLWTGTESQSTRRSRLLG